MNAKEVLKLVLGSTAVYVIMAACSATVPLGYGPGGPDASSDIEGGARTRRVVADGSRVLDALTDPVDEANADPYQSGTRLKATYIAGADGSKQFTGWHDSMLNVDCQFSPAADGNMHCLPTTAASVELSLFADAGCSQPLASISMGCSPGTYAVNGVVNACTYELHLYPIGSMLPSGSNIYSASASGACAALSSGSYDLTRDHYMLGAEIDPSTFVHGAVQVEP